jgi:hypothetical protein
MDSVPFMVGWEAPAGIIDLEAKQLVEEGRDPKWVAEVLGTVDVAKASSAELAGLWSRLQDAPQRSDFPFVEPSDLAAIRAERASASRQFPVTYSENELYDRMLGAWLGRCCGCALGKPVECFMGPHNGLSSKERIKTYLLGIAADEYPLRDYFPGSSLAQDKTGPINCELSQREKIAFMETDDDIRYTVLGQKVLMEKARDFTTDDVMKTWIEELPFGLVCTAETQAYRNYVIRYRKFTEPAKDVDWLWVATHQNPYREWIGAQIRADSWGYGAPGNPERHLRRDVHRGHDRSRLRAERSA